MAINATPYVASKHGVVGLTKALAVDWGQYNIRVNAVCPGYTETEIVAAAIEKQTPVPTEEPSPTEASGGTDAPVLPDPPAPDTAAPQTA